MLAEVLLLFCLPSDILLLDEAGTLGRNKMCGSELLGIDGCLPVRGGLSLGRSIVATLLFHFAGMVMFGLAGLVSPCLLGSKGVLNVRFCFAGHGSISFFFVAGGLFRCLCKPLLLSGLGPQEVTLFFGPQGSSVRRGSLLLDGILL